MVKDPNKRLGAQGGFKEICQHKFFDGINWDDLLKKKVPAPFIPQIENKVDVANFDDEFTSEDVRQPSVLDKDALEMIKMNQGKFGGFK